MVISSLFSIFASLIMIMVIYGFFNEILIKYKHKLFIKFLAYLFILNVGLWFLMPAVLRLLSNGQFEKEIGISAHEIGFVYFAEMISTIIFFLVLSIFLTNGKFSIPNNLKNLLSFISYKKVRISNNQSNILFFSSIGCLIVLLDLNFINILSPYIPSIIVESAYKFFLGFFASYIFLSNISKFRFYFFMLILFFMILLDGIKGSHGSIVWPMIVLYFLANTVKKLKFVNLAIVVCISALIIFYKPLHDLREYEYSLTEKLSPFERIVFLASPSTIPVDTSTTGGGLMDDIEWRFGENTRMSVGYLRMYQRGFNGGTTPIENTLYILPRSITPDKPAPASVDGEVSGMGIYLMHREIRGTIFNMSGMAPSMHEFWIGGWFGVIAGAVLVAAWYSLILMFLTRFSGLALPFVIALHDTWWQMPKLWSTEAILITTNTIPLIFLWLLIGGICTLGLKFFLVFSREIYILLIKTFSNYHSKFR